MKSLQIVDEYYLNPVTIAEFTHFSIRSVGEDQDGNIFSVVEESDVEEALFGFYTLYGIDTEGFSEVIAHRPSLEGTRSLLTKVFGLTTKDLVEYS